MMTEPLTAAELAEIEARLNAATPGPWFVHPVTGDICHGDQSDDHDNYPLANPCDDEFIAHSRTDVARLLDEVRRLRSERREYADEIVKLSREAGLARGRLEAIGMNGGVQATLDAFREENERLRAELARVRQRTIAEQMASTAATEFGDNKTECRRAGCLSRFHWCPSCGDDVDAYPMSQGYCSEACLIADGGVTWEQANNIEPGKDAQ